MEIGKRQAFANAIMKQAKVDHNVNDFHVGNDTREIKQKLMDLKARKEFEINMVSSQIERIRHAAAGIARSVPINFLN